MLQKAMVFGVFSLYFSTLESKKLTYEKLSFKTELKTEFLWPYTEHKKVPKNISLNRNKSIIFDVQFSIDYFTY